MLSEGRAVHDHREEDSAPMIYRFQNVKVLRVIDGDTLDLEFDFGFGHKWHPDHTFRLWGIDTPELRGPNASVEKAKEAAKFVVSYIGGVAEYTYRRGWVLTNDVRVGISSHDPGKQPDTDRYGRWVVEVLPFGALDTLNNALVSAGFAVKAYR